MKGIFASSSVCYGFDEEGKTASLDAGPSIDPEDRRLNVLFSGAIWSILFAVPRPRCQLTAVTAGADDAESGLAERLPVDGRYRSGTDESAGC